MAKRRRFTAKLKAKLYLKHSRVKVHKQNCVVAITSAKPRSPRGNAKFLQSAETFFESADKPSSESAERVAQLEQLVGRLTLALDIQKKHRLSWIAPAQQRGIVEKLRTRYSVRKLICEVLGFNKSTLYHQPKSDPSEDYTDTGNLDHSLNQDYDTRDLTRIEFEKQNLVLILPISGLNKRWHFNIFSFPTPKSRSFSIQAGTTGSAINVSFRQFLGNHRVNPLPFPRNHFTGSADFAVRSSLRANLKNRLP